MEKWNILFIMLIMCDTEEWKHMSIIIIIIMEQRGKDKAFLLIEINIKSRTLKILWTILVDLHFICCSRSRIISTDNNMKVVVGYPVENILVVRANSLWNSYSHVGS